MIAGFNGIIRVWLLSGKEGLHMKISRKIVSAALIFTILLSVSGCGKNFKKIEADDLYDKAIDHFNFDENNGECAILSNFTISSSVVDSTEYSYDLDDYYFGIGLSDKAVPVIIEYLDFKNEDDAREYFNIKVNGENDLKGCFYTAVSNKEDDFEIYYYVDDTVISVSAYNEDAIKELKSFLGDIGYPYPKSFKK